jgi:hypothetical protein
MYVQYLSVLQMQLDGLKFSHGVIGWETCQTQPKVASGTEINSLISIILKSTGERLMSIIR